MNRLAPLHPLLWAAFPVLFLYEHNLQELRLRSILLPLAAAMLAALVLTAVLARVLRDPARAASVASLLLIGFFSYGHLYLWLEQHGLVRHRFLMPAWSLGMVAGCAWIARTRRPLGWVSGLSSTIVLALLATTVVQIAMASHSGPAPPRARPGFAAADPALPVLSPGQALPDIYYILLDAYGGEESLSRYFAFDNREFLDGLARRGFFVARHSHANYMITHLAMAASLNMTYVDSLTDQVGTDSRNLHVLNNLIRDNRVARLLSRAGYEVVVIHSPADLSARDFPNLLFQTTLVAFWTSIEHHRRQTLRAFETIETLPESDRPRFVYAHVLCPHGPYVFGPNGERIRGLELKRALGGVEGIRERYVGQVRYVNRRVERIVDGILARSKTPPIILLQADHGPIAGENLEIPTARMLNQRVPILNALLLPGETSDLPSDLSPVNGFRVVLNRVFDADLPLLDNRTYYSNGRLPYRLTQVDDPVASFAPLPCVEFRPGSR